VNLEFLPRVIVPGLFGLLHVTAVILALAYWRRYSSACALLLAGAILNLLVALARFALPAVLRPGNDAFSFTLAFSALSIVSLLGYGLMLMAVFAGRSAASLPPSRPRAVPESDEQWEQPEPEPPPDSTGIEEHK
jgi:hypothetical protein